MADDVDKVLSAEDETAYQRYRRRNKQRYGIGPAKALRGTDFGLETNMTRKEARVASRRAWKTMRSLPKSRR